jgi:hypothetical protein
MAAGTTEYPASARELLPARFCASAEADGGYWPDRDSFGEVHRLLSNRRRRLPRTQHGRASYACASLF